MQNRTTLLRCFSFSTFPGIAVLMTFDAQPGLSNKQNSTTKKLPLQTNQQTDVKLTLSKIFWRCSKCLAEFSVFLSLEASFSRLQPFSFFLDRGLFIITSHLDFLEKTVRLDLSLERLDRFINIFSDYFYFDYDLSPSPAMT